MTPATLVRKIVGVWPWSEVVSFIVSMLAGLRQVIANRTDAKLAQQLGVDPVGRTARDLTARDEASLTTIRDRYSDDDIAERVERFVEDTLLQYEQDEMLDAAAEFGATSWQWETVGDNCDECDEKDGQEFSITENFRTHPGCNCKPVPVFAGGYSDLAEEEARADD